MVARSATLTLAVLCACACAVKRDDARAPDLLAGQWSLVMTIDASPRGAADTGHALSGNAAFVSDSSDSRQAYGAYSLEPAARSVVGVANEHRIVATRIDRDSVRIVLGPTSSESSVEMRRRLSGDTVTGVWGVVLARAAAARGHFVMIRRQ